MAWPITGTSPAPVTLVDVRARRTGLSIYSAAVAASRSANWIASNHLNSDGTRAGIDIVGRNGGVPRTLTACTQVLGWWGERIVCSNGAALYALDPATGAPTLLATRGRTDLEPPVDGPESSPDGTVVIITENNSTYLSLAASGLNPLPADLVYSTTGLIWRGPHQAIGLSPATSRVEYIDVQSGRIEQQTSASVDGFVQALSGDWVAWMGTTTVHLSHLDDGRDVDLGIRGTAYALGSKGFLLRGDTGLYLVRLPSS